MAVDKNKITAEATKLVQKGQWDKAIKAYERILADDAKDVRVLLKVGELHQKKGDNAAAALVFNRVADAYGEQGFFLKAVAVFKQILKLTPDDARVNERLASLYQQLGLMSDAMAQLQQVAAAHEKANDTGHLTEVLRRMVELDPENVASNIKLGELYAKASQNGPALEQFRRAAEYLKKNNRIDEYVKVAERIAYLSPEEMGLTRELANIYLAKGDTKRALAKLQLCFKASPKDIETLNLLAQAFRDLGQLSKTVSVFKELAHVYTEQGKSEDARATYRKVLELAPDDPDAMAVLGPPAQAAPHPSAAAAPVAPPPVRAAASPPPPSSPRVQPEPHRPGPATLSGVVEPLTKLLTETDVYIKYGLHDKALEHVRRILELDPESPEGHEKAREIQLARGDQASAATEGVLAARAWLGRRDAERATSAVMRLREIAPGHPDLKVLLVATGLPPEEQPIEPLLIEAEEELLVDEPAVPDDGDELALSAAGEEGEEVIEEPDEASPEDDEDADEPIHVAPPPPVPVVAAPPPPEPKPLPPPPGLAQPSVPRPAPRASPVPAPVPPPARAPTRAPAPAPAPAAADLSDELEEVEFYIQQGLVDEARDTLENLLTLHPGHPGVKAKLDELDRKTKAPEPAAPAPVAKAAPARPSPAQVEQRSSEDEAFDIARQLAEEIGEPAAPASAEEEFQYSVEDVFSQFKKGVEKTVKPEDTQTHYDLGIAYKEMGLLDDAIHEFEMALTGPTRAKDLDCLTMIGLCQMMKGEPQTAVGTFRRALRTEGLTADAAKALYFELAVAYEAEGDGEVALYCFQKIRKVDSKYREVDAQVARLGGGPGRPPKAEAARPAAPAHAPSNGATSKPAEKAPRAASSAPPPAPPRPGPKKNIGYL
jgi:tetratricopeptide (TPR) repeat protein